MVIPILFYLDEMVIPILFYLDDAFPLQLAVAVPHRLISFEKELMLDVLG